MKAAGRWAWWNHHVPRYKTLPECVERARAAKLDGVIVKARYWDILEGFRKAGIRVGVEVYTKPMSNATDADALVEGIRRGAEFAVVNAEVKWEQPESGEQIRQLCNRVMAHSDSIELYASVDTRGRRMSMPYQQVLSQFITGWMPMIYPKAFYPAMPAGFVWAAFRDCLDYKDFAGKPVLPTIQTYDNITGPSVKDQLFDIHTRGFQGYQAYTIGHATDAEWQVIVDDAPEEETPDMRDSGLDSLIVGLDNEPIRFRVLQADMTFKEEILVYRRWLTLMVLGFLESTHSHTIKLV